MKVFLERQDYRSYLGLLALQSKRHDLAIWAYCLMPNHVHLIVIPATATGLSRPLGEAHRRYATLINKRHGWTGHLWQERFASFPMDERHLLAAVRYVLMNPVRAGLTATPLEWPHTSATAHRWRSMIR
jgi:putative transposase